MGWLRHNFASKTGLPLDAQQNALANQHSVRSEPITPVTMWLGGKVQQPYVISWRSRISGFAICATLIFMGFKIFKYFDNHDWPSVTGRITETGILRFTSRRGGTGTSYQAHVKYIFLVNHVSYVRDETVGGTFYDETAAQTFLQKQYWKGQHLRVMYRAENPQDSSLNHSLL